jgi:hypothetical protein
MRGRFLIFLLMSVSTAFAQERIVFMNGKEKPVLRVIGLKDKNLVYLTLKDSTEKKVTINKVFASIDKAGKENILYRQDSAVEYELTPEQMKMYVLGEQEAMRTYKSPGSYYTGGIAGIAGGLLIPFFSPLALVPPATGAIIANSFHAGPDKEKIGNSSYLQSQEFLSGYQYKARTIRLKSSLLGAAAGLIGTLGILIVTGSLK